MKPQLKVWHLFALAIIFALASRFQPLPVAHAQGRSVVDAVINVARPSLAYTQAMDYDASGNCTYIGTANSANSGGPSQSAAVWSIRKITYNASNQATLIQWAGGSTSETNVWNNRASLSYQ